MTSRLTAVLLFVMTILLAAAVIFAGFYPDAPNAGFASATAALGMITAVAVGIERVIEGFWTIVGLTKGSFWPFNVVGDQVNAMVSDLDTRLNPVVQEMEGHIATLQAAGEGAAERLKEARADLDKFKQQVGEMKKLAPDNQRVNLVAAAAFQNVSFLEKKYPAVVRSAEIANQAIAGVADFVATFKDNPGRRLVSIYLGAILGLAVAGFVGLDLFRAANASVGEPRPSANTQTTTPPAPGAASNQGAGAGGNAEDVFWWGVVFTGLLMGLGSNPTHEVIRAVQEIKKSRKADNDPVIETGAAGGAAEPQGAGLAAVAADAPRRGINTFSLRRRR